MISAHESGAAIAVERNSVKELNRSQIRAPSGRKLTEPNSVSVGKKKKFNQSPANFMIKQNPIQGLV